MAAERDTDKYRYIGPRGEVKHSGIPNNLDRREGELRREYGPGNIKQVGHRTTRGAAKEWERGKPSAGRAGP